MKIRTWGRNPCSCSPPASSCAPQGSRYPAFHPSRSSTLAPYRDRINWGEPFCEPSLPPHQSQRRSVPSLFPSDFVPSVPPYPCSSPRLTPVPKGAAAAVCWCCCSCSRPRLEPPPPPSWSVFTVAECWLPNARKTNRLFFVNTVPFSEDRRSILWLNSGKTFVTRRTQSIARLHVPKLTQFRNPEDLKKYKDQNSGSIGASRYRVSVTKYPL